jgi:hypothetical protein
MTHAECVEVQEGSGVSVLRRQRMTTDVNYQGQSASFEAKDDFDFGLLKMGIAFVF